MVTDSPKTKKVFEPEDEEELLRGWLLHSHKGRQRHDRVARWLDRERLLLGAIATMFASAVGASIFTALERESSDRFKIVIATISILSAILGGLSTFLDLAGRAGKHRAAGVRYKAMIRELELRLSERVSNVTIPSSVLEI